MSIDSTMPPSRWGRLVGGVGAFAVSALSLGLMLTAPAQAVPTSAQPDVQLSWTTDAPAVVPGQNVVTFAVDGVPTNTARATTVTFTADMSAILRYATLVPGSSTIRVGKLALPSPTDPITPVSIPSNGKFTWSGSVPAGQRVQLKYQLKISDDAPRGSTLASVVAGPNSNCQTGAEAGCTLNTKVWPFSLYVENTVNPPSGSTVLPGQVLDYTISVRNDLQREIKSVAVNCVFQGVGGQQTWLSVVPGSWSASVDGKTAAGSIKLRDQYPPYVDSLSDGVLMWDGPLAAGATVTIKFQVLVGESHGASAHVGESLTVSGTGEGPDDGMSGAYWPHVMSNCQSGDNEGCHTELAAPMKASSPTGGPTQTQTGPTGIEPTHNGPTGIEPTHNGPTGSDPTRINPPRHEPNRPDHPDCPGPWVDIPDDPSVDVPDNSDVPDVLPTGADTPVAQAGDAPADDPDNPDTVNTGGSVPSSMLPVLATMMLGALAALLVGRRVWLRKPNS